MPNVPPDFPYLVGSDADAPNADSVATNQYPAAPVEPIETSATTRYWPLYDRVTRTIRMWKSTDNGKTWTQKDAANGYVVPANGTGGTPIQIWQQYDACFDGVSKIYVATWSQAAPYKICLVPFDTTSDTWQVSIISTLVRLNTTVASVPGWTGIKCAYSATTGEVCVMLAAGAVDASDCQTIWGARCAPGGAGWDANWTRIGGVYQDGVFHTMGSLAVDDATGDFHFIYENRLFGLGGAFTYTVTGGIVTSTGIVSAGAGYQFPENDWSTFKIGTTGDDINGGQATTVIKPAVGDVGIGDGVHNISIVAAGKSCALTHRVWKAGRVLSAENTVVHGVNPPAIGPGPLEIISNLKINEGRMSFAFVSPGTLAEGALNIARAILADSPAWEITQPAAINAVQTSALGYGNVEIKRANGLDYAFFGWNDNTGNSHYGYITSADIGSPWSATTTFADVDNISGPVFYGITVQVLRLYTNPTDATIGIPAGINFGMGYWESVSAPPVPNPQIVRYSASDNRVVVLPDILVQCRNRNDVTTCRVLRHNREMFMISGKGLYVPNLH